MEEYFNLYVVEPSEPKPAEPEEPEEVKPEEPEEVKPEEPEEPKPEEPEEPEEPAEPEEVKPEEPKAEEEPVEPAEPEEPAEPKAEEVKPEEPEEPKAEEPKAEEPKPEEVKPEEVKPEEPKAEEVEILVYKIIHCSRECIEKILTKIKKISAEYGVIYEGNDTILIKNAHGYFQDIVLENVRTLVRLNSDNPNNIKSKNYILQNIQCCAHVGEKLTKLKKIIKIKTFTVNKLQYLATMYEAKLSSSDIDNKKNIDEDLVKKLLRLQFFCEEEMGKDTKGLKLLLHLFPSKLNSIKNI